MSDRMASDDVEQIAKQVAMQTRATLPNVREAMREADVTPTPDAGGSDPTPDAGGSEHACEVCGRDFDSAQALAGHKSAHTGDGDTPDAGGKTDPDAVGLDRWTAAMFDDDGKAKRKLRKRVDGRAESRDYKRAFGPCDEPGCDRGTNGFKPDYCNKHA